MRESLITRIAERAESIAINLDALVKALPDQNHKGRYFDRSKAISGRDSTFFDVETRIRIIVDIAESFKSYTRANWLPLSYIERCDAALDSLFNAVVSLLDRFTDISSNYGGYRSFDYGTWEGHAQNSSLYQIINEARRLFDVTEEALPAVLDCYFVLKPKGAASFQSSSTRLAEIIATSDTRLAELSAEIKQASDLKNRITESLEVSKDEVREIGRLKESSDNDRKTIAEHLAQTTVDRAGISSVVEQSEQLHVLIKTYQSDLKEFQASLDNRKKVSDQGAKALTDLVAAFEGNREKIEQLITRSEQMLSSATVAGLATNFSDMTEKLTGELLRARQAFYVGIAFLTLSALPLLAFVLTPIAVPVLNWAIPGLNLPVSENVSTMPTPWHYLGQVLARIAILLPAAWLVSFAGIRHSSLFRLREHYAYKYSMAVAVEGFKQQAPEYSNEIAALVLEQLAFNPADKLHTGKDQIEGKAPGLAGFLLDKIRARLEATSPAKK